MTWKLKGCSRCGGDLFIDKDSNGWYEECILCGNHRELMIPIKHEMQEDWRERRLKRKSISE
jgi:rRNA maturation protein Nop10